MSNPKAVVNNAGSGSKDEDKHSSTQLLPESFDRRYASQARPYNYNFFRAPTLVKQLFAHFPLKTLKSESGPVRLAPVQATSPASKDAPRKPQLWTLSPSNDPLVPSSDLTCLTYQTFLLACNVSFDVIRTPSTEGAPSGQLPFAVVHTEKDKSRTVKVTELRRWTLQQDPKNRTSPTQLAREEVGVDLLEQYVRPAWLHALYLTPVNARGLLYETQVKTATASWVARARLLERKRREAVEELRAKVEPELVQGKSEDVSVVLNERAGRFLDELVGLLGNETFFGGEEQPGFLDAAVFAYTHLLTRHDFGKTAGWIDGSLSEKVRARKALMRHEDAVYRTCYKQR